MQEGPSACQETLSPGPRCLGRCAVSILGYSQKPHGDCPRPLALGDPASIGDGTGETPDPPPSSDPMTCVWDVPVHGCLCAAAVGGRGLRCVCAGVHDGLHMDVPPMSVCSVCIQLGVHVDQHVCAHTTAHVTEVLVCPCALLCRLICVAVGMAGSDWKGGSSVCVPMCYCENCI